MADFGVVPQGFVRKTLREILAEIETDQLTEIESTLDVSADQPLGQVNGIFSRQLALLWEVAEACYHGFNPDAAEDFLLTSLCKLTGTVRRGASQSEVLCTVNVDEGVTLLAGEHFAHVDGRPDLRFTPKDNFVAPSSGDHDDVRFVSENSGPIPANATTLTVIATPVVGWNSINNPNSALLGRPVDDDPTLRERREAQLTAVGSSTVDAIAADVLAADQDIISVRVFENRTSSTDHRGLPPHSFEVLVYDDNLVPNTIIAQAIWDTKPAGIEPFGAVSEDAIDSNGDAQLMRFTRPTARAIHIELSLQTGTGYVGDSAVKDYIAEQAGKRFKPGDSVIALFLKCLPLHLTGVIDVTSFTLGFATSPTNEDNLILGLREHAAFDTSRITIT